MVGARGLGKSHHFTSQRSPHNLEPSPPEIKEHGEQCPKMQSDVECKLMSRRKLVPAQQSAHDNEMPRAGDRNKFGQTLNDRQNHGLVNWQVIALRFPRLESYAPLWREINFLLRERKKYRRYRCTAC